jgi:hypothetical protein
MQLVLIIAWKVMQRGSCYKTIVEKWLILFFPNMRRTIRGRYHKRSDAEGHLAILRRQVPGQAFILLFDSNPTEDDLTGIIGDIQTKTSRQ